MLPGDIVSDTRRIARDLTQRQTSAEELRAGAGADDARDADEPAAALLGGRHSPGARQGSALGLLAADGGDEPLKDAAGDAAPAFSTAGGWSFQSFQLASTANSRSPPKTPRRA
jgi:hypothetical protein